MLMLKYIEKSLRVRLDLLKKESQEAKSAEKYWELPAIFATLQEIFPVILGFLCTLLSAAKTLQL